MDRNAAGNPGHSCDKPDVFPEHDRKLEVKNIDKALLIVCRTGIGVFMENRRDTQHCIHMHFGIFAQQQCRSQMPSWRECHDPYMVTREAIYNFPGSCPDCSGRHAACSQFSRFHQVDGGPTPPAQAGRFPKG